MAANPVERLLNVIMTIGSRRRIDRARLMESIPEYRAAVSEDARLRMFERDKAEIIQLGIPLRSDYDPFEDVVHYRIEAPSTTDELNLTTEEYTVLLAASRAWDERAVGGSARRGRVKLLSFGQEADEDLLRRTPRGSLESFPVLSPLLDAVTSGQAVTFQYRTAANKVSKRTVEPWIVGVHDGHWYLWGFDRDRDAPRLFRASRMESFPKSLGPARAERPQELSLERQLARLDDSEDRAAAEVRVRPFKAQTLRERADVGQETERFTLPMLPRPACRRLMLPHVRWAELLAPQPWREELVDVLARISALHEGDGDLSRIDRSEEVVRPRIRIASTGQDRLSRLISATSYVLAHGGADLEELANALGISKKQLVDDLTTLFMCGDLGTGFEDLIEATWEHGAVHVRNAEPLGRALRLTGGEIAALLAGLSVLDASGGPEQAIIASTRRKLRAAQGGAEPTDDSGSHRCAGAVAAESEAEPEEAASAPVGESAETASASITDPAPTGLSRAQIRAHIDRALAAPDGALTIRYSSPASPGTSVRRLSGLRLESDGARTYVRAHCDLVDGERTFRLERIVDVLPGDAPLHADATSAELDLSGTVAGDVWLRLEPPARWIEESFDAVEMRESTADDDGARPGLLVKLQDPVRFALVDAVLESAGAAEVLQPRELRDTIVTVARDAMARHGAPEPLR